jgi:hypothetical protein
MIKRLLKRIAFALADDYYNICRAKDYQRLQNDFRNIVKNSKQYLYLCCGSRMPILLRDEFRDMMLDKIRMKNPGLDLKILIREDLFRILNYCDTSFAVTKDRVPDFVLSDAGNMIIVPQSWNFGKVRDEFPGEDIKKRFLETYNAARVQPVAAQVMN